MPATKVLVVEDERIVALNLQQRLVKLGYEVPIICANGAQAVDNVENNHPDIVLMDINIEGDFDGIEAAARIGKTADTPIIFLTAYCEEATLIRARATHPYGYLLKPFSERELHATILVALEQHKVKRETNEALYTQISDNTALQLRMKASADQLALRELAARLVGKLAVAAEASSRVYELLGSALTLLCECGGWQWGAVCAFKSTRQRNAQVISIYNNGELTIATDADADTDKRNQAGDFLDDLQPWRYASWLDEDALNQVIQSRVYNGPARAGFWMPILIADRLYAGLVFLQTAEIVDHTRWDFLFDHITKELSLFIERKEYQERLRQLSSAIEHSPVSVMITDVNGDIEYVNPQFTAATGYTADEVLEKNPRFLKAENSNSETYSELWEKLASGETWRGEFHNQKKSGEEFWESSAIAPVSDSRGKTTHYVAVKEDITERKRIGQELHTAKEAAEAANMAKSSFLANMSHEIRTPLNAILGLNFLLQKTPLSPIQIDYVQKTETAAEFLLSVLNDILDLSKIEAGKLDLETVDFELDGLLNNVRTILQAKADEKHLQLVIDLPADVPHRLRGDPLRIKQILVNLGGNAIKFTDSGRITIEVRLEASAEQIPGGSTDAEIKLRISVRDTGIGLSAAQKAILFEVFKQGDTSTTRRYGGSGLGLAICRRLVVMMGGAIDVVSTPGKGSDFNFFIPLERAQQELAPVMIERAADEEGLDKFKGARVLLVEDSELNQQVACAILKYLGINPDVAVNGREAVEMIKTRGSDYYRLVFMDIQMPEMDGFTATRELRKLDTIKQLPIVAMTADVMSEGRDQCFAAGMNDYITKPINIRQLTDTLIRWLS